MNDAMLLIMTHRRLSVVFGGLLWLLSIRVGKFYPHAV